MAGERTRDGLSFCAKFDGFSYSRFGFIVRTDGQTDRQTDRITDAAKRFTLATVVGVSNYRTEAGRLKPQHVARQHVAWCIRGFSVDEDEAPEH